MTDVEKLEMQVAELRAKLELAAEEARGRHGQLEAQGKELGTKLHTIEKWAWVIAVVAGAFGIATSNVWSQVQAARNDAATARAEAQRAVTDLAGAKADAVNEIRRLGPSLLIELKPEFAKWVDDAKRTIAPSLLDDVKSVRAELSKGLSAKLDSGAPGTIVAAGLIGPDGTIRYQAGGFSSSHRTGGVPRGSYDVYFSEQAEVPIVIATADHDANPGASAEVVRVTKNSAIINGRKHGDHGYADVQFQFVVVRSGK
jgi:hypothetical protein